MALLGKGAYADVRVVDGSAVKCQRSRSRSFKEYKWLRCLRDTGVVPQAHALILRGDSVRNHELWMERIVGPNLHLIASRRVTHQLTLKHVRDAQVALLHLWRVNVVHADIKPANIVLCTRRDRLVLVDFGISVAAQQSRAARELYTPGYKAPEIAHATPAARVVAHPATDVYAMGITLLQAFAGLPRPPTVWWAARVTVRSSVHDAGVRGAILKMITWAPPARRLVLVQTRPSRGPDHHAQVQL